MDLKGTMKSERANVKKLYIWVYLHAFLKYEIIQMETVVVAKGWEGGI